ncbi:hypothetical protein LTR05_003492 [Lithohypha guttulata]|uniref:Uncharacterized protein n=1 Tax=Lithohypha guttulata TaxID=1690604 RepID=A0AAN7YHD4_9EURO|nr:hypothetical protein LTR05_003492 [Lithohypha guttulata]
MAGNSVLGPALRRLCRDIPQKQCRTFSSTTCDAATVRTPNISRQLQKAMSKQKSLSGQMKKMGRGQMGDDFGLLPETLIKPERKNLPSILSKRWQRRIQIEWLAFKQKVQAFVALVLSNRWQVKKDPLTNRALVLPLLLRERYAKARELHRELYKAIAEGDNDTIRRISCTGLKRSLQIRLDQRKAMKMPPETWDVEYRGLTNDDKLYWWITALIPPRFRSTQIITDRSAQLPVGTDSSARQVVVKIKTKQTLDKNDGKGPKTVNKDEYVVLQRLRFDGEEDDWQIWGTTSPSNEEDINAILSENASAARRKMTFMERLRDQGAQFAQRFGSKAGS